MKHIVQVFMRSQWTVGIVRASRFSSESAIVVGLKTVLERQMRAFDATLRLRTVGAKNVDVQLGIVGIDAEDARLVAVERNRLPMHLDVPSGVAK
jgi:hypothetical protein